MANWMKGEFHNTFRSFHFKKTLIVQIDLSVARLHIIQVDAAGSLLTDEK